MPPKTKKKSVAASAASSRPKQQPTEASSQQDSEMVDAPPAAAEEPSTDAGNIAAEEAEEEEEEVRVNILPGSDDTAASFEFINEGHTLGNALRWVIMKNPDVEFCAYTIPHPSEAKMHVRIQTYEGNAIDALQKGLRDLASMCDVMADEFTNKMVAFKAGQGEA